jgi:hypothetical protein
MFSGNVLPESRIFSLLERGFALYPSEIIVSSPLCRCVAARAFASVIFTNSCPTVTKG